MCDVRVYFQTTHVIAFRIDFPSGGAFSVRVCVVCAAASCSFFIFIHFAHFSAIPNFGAKA